MPGAGVVSVVSLGTVSEGVDSVSVGTVSDVLSCVVSVVGRSVGSVSVLSVSAASEMFKSFESTSLDDLLLSQEVRLRTIAKDRSNATYFFIIYLHVSPTKNILPLNHF